MAKEKANKIDWIKFWERMDTWYQSKSKSPCCKKCKRATFSEPEWEDQMKWIEKEINRLVRRGGENEEVGPRHPSIEAI